MAVQLTVLGVGETMLLKLSGIWNAFVFQTKTQQKVYTQRSYNFENILFTVTDLIFKNKKYFKPNM